MLPQPQVVPIIFEGLDTYTDPRRGIPAKLDLLENCYITSPLKLRKRNGFTSQSRSIDGGGSVSAGVKLASYRNEIVMTDGLIFYTRNAVTGTLVKRAKLPSGQVKVERLTSDTVSNDRLLTTGCYAGGVELYAWQTKNVNTTSWKLRDSSTGATLNQGTVTGMAPRAVACNGFLFLIVVDTGTGNLVLRKADPAAPTTMGSPNTIIAGTATTVYDVVADTATPQLMLASYEGTAATVQVRTINPTSLAVGGPTAFTQTGGGNAVILSWLFHDYSNGSAYLTVYWFTAGSYVYDISRTTRAMSNATLIDAAFTGNALIGYFASATRVVFSENYATSIDKNIIKVWSQGTTAELMRSITFSSKVFKQGTRYYFAASYEDTTQRHRVLVEYEHGTIGANGGTAVVGYLEAKTDGGVGGPGVGAATLPYATSICDPVNFGGNAWGLPWHYSFDLGGNYGVASPRVTFSETGVGTAERFADVLFVPGMQLNVYDGAQCVEHGFYLKPQIAVSVTAVGGGFKVNGGNYNIKLVYEWTDSAGRILRSEAGPVYSAVAGPGGALQIVAPTLRLTNKDPKFNLSTPPAVRIVAYCTINNGTTYYRESVTGANSTTADTVTFTIGTSDAAIQSNEILYQSGGVIANETPPAVRLVQAFGNRLFVCAGDGDIWHSKDLAEGEATAFSARFRIPLDTSSGRVTALMSMDQSFMMGQRNGVYLLGGGDPTDTGANLFASPTRINTTIGPIDQVSVVRLPGGLAYNSPRGIYLMSRGLDSQFIGAQVQRYTLTDTITGAQLSDDVPQARWTTSNGELLVYDHAIGQWYVYTGLAAAGCALYQNTFAILASDGTIKLEAPGTFVDDATSIIMKLRTSWLSLAGFAGYQRLWDVLVVGEDKGAHQLQMSFAYNGSAFVNETLVANAGAATYDTTIEGGYIWEAQPKQQICTSVQITIQDLAQGGPTTEAFYLTGIALNIGVLGGAARLPVTKSLA